jgi:hypothetical protein
MLRAHYPWAVDVLHTYDEDLIKISGKVGNLSLRICKPGDEAGQTSFMLASNPTRSKEASPRFVKK